MARHVIVGKGPVGTTLAELLVQAGEDVVALSRSGGTAVAGVRAAAVDASDPVALARAAAGADVLYNCANPPYHRWPEDWPPIAAALLSTAECTGAVLVTMSNLYGYGPAEVPLTEDLALAAPGAKGRVRARMWQQALAAHQAGRARVTEARASDFVGPRVVAGGHLGERVVPRLLAGKRVSVVGDPDAAHSWTDVREVARALVLLGRDERAWGRAWHVPTAPPVSTREAVAGMCRAAGTTPVTVFGLPRLLLRTAGLAVPLFRELQETWYQFDRPFIVDSSAFTRTFGLGPRPLEQTWADTVTRWRSRPLQAPELRRTGTPARPGGSARRPGGHRRRPRQRPPSPAPPSRR